MVLKLGISLLNLIESSLGIPFTIPSNVRNQLDKITVVDYRSMYSEDTYVHFGTIQSDTSLLPLTGRLPVELPGINTGLPFRLMFKRSRRSDNQNIEPLSQEFILDLFLRKVSIEIPGLRAARLVKERGRAPHLERDLQRRKVRIVGSGVLRITSDAAGRLGPLEFIDEPDPFDPGGRTGVVFSLGFDPPHFLIGECGFTVDRLTVDGSKDYTPPEIMARGHDDGWVGLSIKEATFYLPRNMPLIGDLSIGVHDLLLSSPVGMQGSLQIEFGVSEATNIPRFDQRWITFYQDAPPHSPNQLTLEGSIVNVNGLGRNEAILHGAYTPDPPDPPNAGTEWFLPGGTTQAGSRTMEFPVHDGDIVRVRRLIEVDQTNKIVSPETEFTFRFNRSSSGASTSEMYAPKIDLRIPNQNSSFQNVVYVSGTRQSLQGITFTARDVTANDNSLTWQIGDSVVLHRGPSFAVTDIPANTFLVMRDGQGRERRVEIDVLESGRIVIGRQGGIDGKNEDGAFEPLTIGSVESTYDLRTFHMSGERLPYSQNASVAENNRTSINVPSGGLAEVILERGTASNPDGMPGTTTTASHQPFQVLFNFDGSEIDSVVGEDTIRELQSWVTSFQNSNFVVIGHCDDIGTSEYNRNLASRRANTGRVLLVALGISSNITAVGEQDSWDQINLIDFGTIPRPRSGWLANPEPNDSNPLRRDTERELERRPQRRIDIYAVGGTEITSAGTRSEEDVLSAERRRALVPGDDLTEILTPTSREQITGSNTNRQIRPYHVKLIVKWDSPTAVQLSDFIPTQAELTIQWNPRTSGAIRLPTTGGPQEVNIQRANPTSGGATPTPENELVTIVARWTYDARTSQTDYMLTFESSGSSNGIVHIEGNSEIIKLLAIAMALGPALTAGVSPDPGSIGPRLSAIIASIATTGYIQSCKIILYGLRAEGHQTAIRTFSGSRWTAFVDYAVEFHFDATVAGIRLRTDPERRIRIRYRRVGLEFDDSRSGVDKFGLIFDNASMEVEQPGQWILDGPLGNLLRVTGARGGSSSSWVEIDLEFALNMGPISITGATVRFTITGSQTNIELRGFAARVNIPNVLKGGGRLSIGDRNQIRGSLDLEVIPARVKGMGTLLVRNNFYAIEVGVTFPVGIPLAQSGMGVFGFRGVFVANGARSFPNPSNDPIEKEIRWYESPPDNRYASFEGKWVLGLGAIIGTLPDGGYTFNAEGMFVIELPDPTVIFGINAKFLERHSFEPTERSQPSQPANPNFRLLGLIAIDSTALRLGIRGSYRVPKVLNLNVPISGYFPFTVSQQDYYLRIGSDGIDNRTGDPVTIRFLPDTLDVNAWCYLMIEQNRLHRLGGDDRFNFDGFSIGLGLGFGINWSAGPIKLDASARLLAGMGTKPFSLMAGIFISGELSLVVVSISASGEIVLKILELQGQRITRIDGRFCGRIDLLFFSIEGCVGFSIGSDIEIGIPAPPSPLVSVSLTDRNGVVKGKALKEISGHSLTDENTVWPDTVPILEFAHYVETRLDGGSAFSSLSDAYPPNSRWSGSADLKYAYRLVGINIQPVGEPTITGPLDAAWWLPSHRGGVRNVESDPNPSDHEGRILALLSWNPAPWASNLLLDSSLDENDRAMEPFNTIRNICKSTPHVDPLCVVAATATRTSLDTIRFLPEDPKPSSFSNYFEIVGRESLDHLDFEEVASLASEEGMHIVTDRVSDIEFSPGEKKVYYLSRIESINGTYCNMQFDGTFSNQITDPTLTLIVCTGGERKPEHKTDKTCEGFLYRSLEENQISLGWMSYPSHDGINEIPLGSSGIEISMPYFSKSISITMGLAPNDSIRVKAFDVLGNIVTERVFSENDILVISTDSDEHLIARITIKGGSGEAVLTGICCEFEKRELISPFLTLEDPDFRSLVQSFTVSSSSKLGFNSPIVLGTRNNESEVEWNVDSTTEPFSSPDGHEYVLINYKPERPDDLWQSFTIKPSPHSCIGFVKCCGVVHSARVQEEREQEYRDEFKRSWNTRMSGPEPSPRQLVLAANKNYRITINWKWKGWRRSQREPNPPESDAQEWIDGEQDVYFFKTADVLALNDTPPPIDTTIEKDFDVRRTVKYLNKFVPDGSTALPHFLDDPIYVHFTSDYISDLLSKFNRRLEIKIRRTDPPAGTIQNLGHTKDIFYNSKWTEPPNSLLSNVELNILDSAKISGCLMKPRLDGITQEIKAPLEPDSDYDLLLFANSLASGNESELISRGHFHTSHYRNPSELVQGLGFSNPSPYPIPPQDFIVVGSAQLIHPPGTTKIPSSDQDLEMILAGLGIDSLALPPSPRTIAIWKNDDGWKLHGILLDSDEPIIRDNRMVISDASLGVNNLSIICSNKSKTRILMAPASPVSVRLDDTLSLSIKVLPAGKVITESRSIGTGPHSLYSEGLS